MKADISEVVSVLKRIRCEILSEETKVERNVIDAVDKVLREIGIRRGEAKLTDDPEERIELADRVMDRLLLAQYLLHELEERGMSVTKLESVIRKSLMEAEAFKRSAELLFTKTFKPPER